MLIRQFIQSVLGLAILATSSLALSNTEFTYNLIDGGIEVTGCLYDCPTAMIIPNEVDGLNVVSIGENAFHSKGIKSVIIPEGIKVIKRGAFHSNTLTSLALPVTLEYLAGFNNNQISTLAIPENVTVIGTEAFENNKITGVMISNNVTQIGSTAFLNNLLEEIRLPNSLISISGGAFGNNKLKEVTIPATVSFIDEFTFVENPIEKVTFLGNRPNMERAFSRNYVEHRTLYNQSQNIELNCYSDDAGNVICDEYINSFHNLEINNPEVLFIGGMEGWPGNPLLIDQNLDFTSCIPFITSNCINNWINEFVTPKEYTTNDLGNYSTYYSALDIDQNGSFDALTDGLILLRYAFGLRGDNLISGATASDATRTSAAEIEAHIQSLLP
jgi:hypothetical protein